MSTHELLIQQRGTTKRKITNLIKKIDPLVEKQEKSGFNVVCAEQYLKEIRNLDGQFQQQHLEASAVVDLSNEELIEKDFEELEIHDDRVRENISKLLYLLSVASTKPQEAKSTKSKGKKSLETKWNRITTNYQRGHKDKRSSKQPKRNGN